MGDDQTAVKKPLIAPFLARFLFCPASRIIAVRKHKANENVGNENLGRCIDGFHVSSRIGFGYWTLFAEGADTEQRVPTNQIDRNARAETDGPFTIVKYYENDAMDIVERGDLERCA